MSIETFSQNALISTRNGDYLFAGVNNYISIIAQQNEPVFEGEVKAFLYTNFENKKQLEITKENNFFKVRPDSVGVVEIEIQVKDSTEIKKLRVKPIPVEVRIGRFRAMNNRKIPAAEFKAQRGLVAYVNCCGFDARCKTLKFEMIRISKNGIAERAKNIGAGFSKKSKQIIRKVESGDLIFFRQIRYRCPGTSESEPAEDMSFEIE